MLRNATLFIFLSLLVLQTLAGLSFFGSMDPFAGSGIYTPTIIPTNDESIKQVAGFGGTAYYLTENGDVFSAGPNTYGELGLGTFTTSEPFTKIPTLSNITYIAPGWTTAMVLNSEGKIFGFGRGEFGSLGMGTTSNEPTPIEITTLTDIISVKLGGTNISPYSFVIAKNRTTTAQLFVFGFNGQGQLGLGDTTHRFLPVVLNIPNVASVFAGRWCSFAITSSDQVYVWGNNGSGELGLGDTTTRQVPTLLNLPGIVQIVAQSHTLFLNTTGSVFVAGFGMRLGFDNTVTRKVPTYNPNLSDDIVSVANGFAHSVVLDSKGRIYTFGSNSGGTLGFGNASIMQVNTPTYVRDNVVAISCGQKFTLLLTKCPPGSDGDYCNIISCHGTLASDPTVCSTKGTCDGPNNCTCQSGWGGDTCSVMTCAGKLSTDPTVCSGNGQCNVPNTCACSAGWGGSQCETPICGGKLATDPLVCGSRNGTCDAPNTCSCKTGFLGANCDDWNCGLFGRRDVHVCSGKGICYLPNVCGCVAGSTGDNCEKTTPGSSGSKLIGSIGLFVIVLLNYLCL